MIQQSEVRKVIGDYFAAVRAMDVEAWLRTFEPDAVSVDPSGPPAVGHAALRQFFFMVSGAFNEIALEEDCVFVVGNQAAVKFTGRGVGKNGREAIFEGIDVFELSENGKIKKLTAYWDPSDLMAKLLG